MSALTDLFTAMANKIRSKTGTQTTYTPSEMVSDGIDDVYDAGVASVPTPTDITPSNASPVSLTANTAVKPTASGYAIENYSSITPSNSSPVSLTANTIVKPLTIGQAILGYTDLTPSNTDPVQLPLLPPPNQPPIYRLRASGYAIQNYSTATPSDTSPASVSSGAIIKASSSGYLYKTGLPILGQKPDAEFSNNTAGTSGSVNITVTQKPRYIIMSISSRTSAYLHQLGVIDVTGARAWRMGCNADGTYSENWSNYTTYFTTISASTVTFSYAAANYNKRVVIQIYY